MPTLQLKRGTAARWEELNPILDAGEPGYVIDDNKLKFGDGKTPWNDLPYFGESGSVFNASTHQEFPAVGQPDKIYKAESEKLLYQWNQTTSKYEVIGSVSTGTGTTEDFVSARVYEISVAKDGDHISAINNYLNGEEPSAHDVAVVTEAIIADEFLSDTVTQKYQQTAYRWNGNAWTAFDGNYSADNVIFDEDFTFTTKIGTVQTLTNGSTKVAAAGKSIKDFLASIFAAEAYPTATAPSVSWLTEPKATVEVGTEVTPKYSVKLNAGSYTYGPATGVTANAWTISIADLDDENQTSSTGEFSTFVATDNMSNYAKITATASYSAGAVPVTNIGNPYPSKQIGAGSKSAVSAGYTSYRAWFYGYKNNNEALEIDSLDSNKIRALTAANGSFASSITTSNMQQMFFAAPAGIVSNIKVANSVNGAPQTVSKTTVYVKGANGYCANETESLNGGMAYDLFYVSNDNADSDTTTYNITTIKA